MLRPSTVHALALERLLPGRARRCRPARPSPCRRTRASGGRRRPAGRSRGARRPCSSSRAGPARRLLAGQREREHPRAGVVPTRRWSSSRPCQRMSWRPRRFVSPVKNERRRRLEWRARSAIICLKNRNSSAFSLDQRPVEPGELVVLAVGVVVAVLRAADLVAGDEHRHALREEQDRGEVLHLPLAEARRSPGRRSGPRRRSSSSGCRRCRRGCPRRSPRCASRCRRRGR